MFIKMFFLSREIRTFGMICLVGGMIKYIHFDLKYLTVFSISSFSYPTFGELKKLGIWKFLIILNFFKM